jgi:putative membrane protein
MGDEGLEAAMFLDWILASAHHLAIFTLAGILAFELALTAGDVDASVVARLARIDAWYGIVAAVVIAVGVARVFLGAKGASYYAGNSFFWTKMALFAAVGALSALPTLRYLKWRRALGADARFAPPAAELRIVRLALWGEVALFAAIPLCAAAMARGYGM